MEIKSTNIWTRNLLVKISQAELDFLIDLTNDSHKYEIIEESK